MNIDYNKLTNDLIDNFNDYHSLLEVPINGIVWENLLYNSLLMQSSNVEWDYRSHKTGEDVKFESTGISCKGGRVLGKKKDKLKISSYRSTMYKTIEEKINYFDERHEDVYFCLTYENKDNHIYKLYTFDSEYLDYKNLNWEKTKRGWQGTGKFLAKIEQSMSDQLWLWLPVSDLTEQFHIEIEKSNKYNSVKQIIL